MIRIAASDAFMMVELGASIDPVTNARAIHLAHAIAARAVPGVRDVVPAYASVGVHFDPLRTDLFALERAIRDEAGTLQRITDAVGGEAIEVSVRYGGSDGPDLDELARWSGCDADEVIQRHIARTYRVYMLGFVPGFAYMASVDPRIAAPRHQTPRHRVPAGSVGIAGEQTGIYPISTPGGWQIIGRTDAVLFDPMRTPPALFAPGSVVRFVVERAGAHR